MSKRILLGSIIAFFVLIGMVTVFMAISSTQYFHARMILKILDDFSFKAILHFGGLYLHIMASFLAIIIGMIQFIPAVYHKYPRLHKSLGKFYVVLILFFAAPMGFVTAILHTKVLQSQFGFGVLSIFWFLATLVAFKHIIDKKLLLHIEWMIRSFAITTAAMTLRLENILLIKLLSINLDTSNSITSWMSWTINILFAEVFIYFGLGKYFLQKIKSSSMSSS